MILPRFDVSAERTPPLPTDAPETQRSTRLAFENCARIRDLGFTASKHIKMYGEHFELVSDPFVEGNYTAVHAVSRNDPRIRTLRLPVLILIGLADRFRKPVKVTKQATR